MTAAQILADKPQHYSFRPVNTAAAQEHTIDIFNEISDWWGYGIMSLSFDLHGRTEDVRVRLNSPGGDYTQGVAIRSFLESYPGNVTVEVMGLAASSATIIATGANRVEIHAGALYMIHNPATLMGGDANQLQQEIEVLRKIESDMVAMYMDGMKKRDKMNGKTDEEMAAQIKKWMDAETWFSAKEAIDYGFADAIIGTEDATTDAAITAQLSTQIFAQFKNTPQRVINLATMANDKNKPGSILDKIMALINNTATEEAATETTTETTEETTTVDPIQAAKDLLAGQGYTVTEAATETTTETAVEETPVVNTYTEAQIEQMITAALEQQQRQRAAGTSVTAAAAGSESKAKSRAETIKAEAVKKLAPMAKALGGN